MTGVQTCALPIYINGNGAFGGTSNGAININGGTGINIGTIGQGGSASNGGFGGLGLPNLSGANNGFAPGGGGGGAVSVGGGNGAPGQVIVWW